MFHEATLVKRYFLIECVMLSEIKSGIKSCHPILIYTSGYNNVFNMLLCKQWGNIFHRGNEGVNMSVPIHISYQE